MKRVMIIGSCGAGKSILAQKLQKKINLPLYHLDQLYWKENWTETPKEEWQLIAKKLVDKEEWIIDGNYGSTMDLRLNRADTIIYLNVPTYIALYRVIKRTCMHWRKTRPDMAPGCKERFDLAFLHYVLTFNLRNRKPIHEKLNRLGADKKLFILKSNQEVDSFLLHCIPN